MVVSCYHDIKTGSFQRKAGANSGRENGPWMGRPVVMDPSENCPQSALDSAPVGLSLSTSSTLESPGLGPHLPFPKGAMVLKLPSLAFRPSLTDSQVQLFREAQQVRSLIPKGEEPLPQALMWSFLGSLVTLLALHVLSPSACGLL